MRHEKLLDLQVGIQKKGELTQLSQAYLKKRFDVDVPPYNDKDRVLQAEVVTSYGPLHIFFGRNGDLVALVAQGYLDLALVGSDSLQESDLEGQVEVVDSIPEVKWPLVYASRQDRWVAPQDASVVATSYPKSTSRSFQELFGRRPSKLVVAGGSIEMYPYLDDLNGDYIDGISDISVTGSTMRANQLERYPEPLGFFVPTVIASRGFLDNVQKANNWLHWCDQVMFSPQNPQQS